MILTDNDFPLIAEGSRVYSRWASSPILTTTTDSMAKEIVLRLNRDNQAFPEEPNHDQ